MGDDGKVSEHEDEATSLTAANNMINGQIYNMCFPRSGHRFLRNMLEDYFGKELKHCSVYNTDNIRERYNYIKDHDIGLSEARMKEAVFDPGRKYIVQFRHPLYSLTSWYEYRLIKRKINDSQNNWRLFMKVQLKYWERFANKWVISKQGASNICFVLYEDLVSNTDVVLKNIILFITGLDAINDAALKKSVSAYSNKIHRYLIDQKLGNNTVPARDITESKYFDRDLFEKIEVELKNDYLEPMGIPMKVQKQSLVSS